MFINNNNNAAKDELLTGALTGANMMSSCGHE